MSKCFTTFNVHPVVKKHTYCIFSFVIMNIVLVAVTSRTLHGVELVYPALKKYWLDPSFVKTEFQSSFYYLKVVFHKSDVYPDTNHL